MLSIGIDAHKHVHVAVALDAAGRVIDRWRGPNSPAGWQAVSAWASGLEGDARQWGIEGAWNYGRGLAQYLVAGGEAVFEINPRWTAAGRRTARNRGKSDPRDAQAVALWVWRESGTLPRVSADDQTVLLDLLVSERQAAHTEAVRIRSHIHGLLLQIDPEYAKHLPTLASKKGLAALVAYTNSDTVLKHERAAAVRRAALRLKLALDQVAELTARIRELAQAAGLEPLTQVCGINLLTAAALAGILGPGQRFASDADLAAYAGAAPLEASSAGAVRHRLNRGGNRQLNAILHRIAVTQARHATDGRAYLDRRRADGKSMREAIRALKRFLVRRIWHLWVQILARSPRLSAPI
jgi:transposase